MDNSTENAAVTYTFKHYADNHYSHHYSRTASLRLRSQCILAARAVPRSGKCGCSAHTQQETKVVSSKGCKLAMVGAHHPILAAPQST